MDKNFVVAPPETTLVAIPADARERVARELLNQSIRRGMFTFHGRPTDAETMAYELSDSLLAALGIGGA